MSSAGRGERGGGENDYFPTPAWCCARLLERFKLPNGFIVEPSAGDGAIVRACGGNTEYRRWFTCEIDPRFAGDLDRLGVHVTVADFLKMASLVSNAVSLVIGNPPYSLAEQFVRHSRAIFPDAEIVFLLRVNFLGSEDRIALYRELGVPNIFVLPNRPPFSRNKTGKIGTDSCEYAWFHWPAIPSERGRVEILGSTPAKVRADHVRELTEKLEQFNNPFCVTGNAG